MDSAELRPLQRPCEERRAEQEQQLMQATSLIGDLSWHEQDADKSLTNGGWGGPPPAAHPPPTFQVGLWPDDLLVVQLVIHDLKSGGCGAQGQEPHHANPGVSGGLAGPHRAPKE